MVQWLRARIHLFAPVALVLALIALAVDWLLGTHTRPESLTYGALALGGLGLLALKLSTLRKRRDD